MDQFLESFSEKNFIQPLNEWFVCSICENYSLSPVCIKGCEHLYCNRCINKWLLVREDCPQCKIKIDQSHIIPLRECGEFLWRLWSSQKVKCSADSCDWIGSCCDVDIHFHKCEHIPVSCPHCKKFIKRSKLHGHEDLCIDKPRECNICNKLHPKWDTIACTDQFKNENRLLIGKENEVSCPVGETPSYRTKDKIYCPFQPFGCSDIVYDSLELLQVHLKDSMSDHKLLIRRFAGVSVLSEVVSSLDKRVMKLELEEKFAKGGDLTNQKLANQEEGVILDLLRRIETVEQSVRPNISWRIFNARPKIFGNVSDVHSSNFWFGGLLWRLHMDIEADTSCIIRVSLLCLTIAEEEFHCQNQNLTTVPVSSSRLQEGTPAPLHNSSLISSQASSQVSDETSHHQDSTRDHDTSVDCGTSMLESPSPILFKVYANSSQELHEAAALAATIMDSTPVSLVSQFVSPLQCSGSRSDVFRSACCESPVEIKTAYQTSSINEDSISSCDDDPSVKDSNSDLDLAQLGSSNDASEFQTHLDQSVFEDLHQEDCDRSKRARFVNSSTFASSDDVGDENRCCTLDLKENHFQQHHAESMKSAESSKASACTLNVIDHVAHDLYLSESPQLSLSHSCQLPILNLEHSSHAVSRLVGRSSCSLADSMSTSAGIRVEFTVRVRIENAKKKQDPKSSSTSCQETTWTSRTERCEGVLQAFYGCELTSRTFDLWPGIQNTGGLSGSEEELTMIVDMELLALEPIGVLTTL